MKQQPSTTPTAAPPSGHAENDERLTARAPRPGLRWRRRSAILGLVISCVVAIGHALSPKRSGIDWGTADIPSQKGRIFLVTGGTGGIGYESAKALASAGAKVVIAPRNSKKDEEAVASIRRENPEALVQLQELNPGDLALGRTLAKTLNATLSHLDGLINNAGIMEPPARGISADGFEMQFAVNYLGHFTLTAEMLPLLRKAGSPRVVTLSRIAAAREGGIHFPDFQFKQAHDPAKAYTRSKLACLMFASELQRRSNEAGWGIQSIASHPGVSRTDLLVNHSGAAGMMRHTLSLLFQPADRGALPTLHAATAPGARGGSYDGPVGVGETRGPLGFATVTPTANDSEAAARLWTVSEELTGTRYP